MRLIGALTLVHGVCVYEVYIVFYVIVHTHVGQPHDQ